MAAKGKRTQARRRREGLSQGLLPFLGEKVYAEKILNPQRYGRHRERACIDISCRPLADPANSRQLMANSQNRCFKVNYQK